ncbi:hypothetical protein GCM10010407_18870 [Rarobacter incanus]
MRRAFGVAAGAVAASRAVDVGPTVMSALGIRLAGMRRYGTAFVRLRVEATRNLVLFAGLMLGALAVMGLLTMHASPQAAAASSLTGMTVAASHHGVGAGEGMQTGNDAPGHVCGNCTVRESAQVGGCVQTASTPAPVHVAPPREFRLRFYEPRPVADTRGRGEQQPDRQAPDLADLCISRT